MKNLSLSPWRPLRAANAFPAGFSLVELSIMPAIPGKGQMVVRYWDGCMEASSASDYDAGYALSESSTQCAPGIRKIF